eukprot:scaffold31724_cov59-Phaeocystis_antarctica.AAC.9
MPCVRLRWPAAATPAAQAGAIHGWYRIEDESACSIAGRAGLLQPNSSVALLAHQRAVAACERASEREMRPRANQRNRGQVTLSSASQLGSAEAAVRELSAKLGYDLL